MIPIRTQPRFQCEFCKRRSVKHVMEIHEKRCFRNPNRYCDHCQNAGFIKVYVDSLCGGIGGTTQESCEYCSKFDAEQLKAIEEREQSQ